MRALSTAAHATRHLGPLHGGVPAPALVLAAHGSRDPVSAATVRALARRVLPWWPAPVVAAFLDFDEPCIPDALAALPPGPAPVVVPALLTNAYHGRVDLPGLLAAAPRATVLAEVLGPDPLLLTALRSRLSELDTVADAVALLAAGTADPVARSTVDSVAAELGRMLGVSCVVGYVTASMPTVSDAMHALRAKGARRTVAASYFLASGLLYASAERTARELGAVGVAAPLGTADEVVRLVVTRARAALRSRAMACEGTKKAPVGVPGHSS